MGVASALGSDEPCLSFDIDMSGDVSVDEILVAVTHAVMGCPL
ncbi:MAG TPA: hypothetical protein VEB21_13250 [Terriglobales bacterium]|nr:hypothetical protein [Terriglobales bacterium]